MLHSCAPLFLVLLLATTQSAGLSITVSPNPLVIGQPAAVTYIRGSSDPSNFNVVVQPTNWRFPVVVSGGQSTFRVALPSSVSPGSYTLQASDGKSTLATIQFSIVSPGQSSDTPTHQAQTSAVVATSASESPTQSSVLSTVSNTPGVSSASSSSVTVVTSPQTKQDSPAGAGTGASADVGTVEGTPATANALSAAGISHPTDASSGFTTPSVSVYQQPGSPPTSTPISATSSSSSPKTARIVGGVIGALVALALLAFLAIFFVRRYRAKQRQNTVQFYQQRMVQPRQLDPAQGNVSTNLISTTAPLAAEGYPRDTKAPSEQLPEYGYSNYDIVEKADYYRMPGAGTGASSAYGGAALA